MLRHGDGAAACEPAADLQEWPAQTYVAHLVDVEVVVFVDRQIGARLRVQLVETGQRRVIAGHSASRRLDELIPLAGRPLEVNIRVSIHGQSQLALDRREWSGGILTPGGISQLEERIIPPAENFEILVKLAQKGAALLRLRQHLWETWRKSALDDVPQSRSRSRDTAEPPQPSTGVKRPCGEPV